MNKILKRSILSLFISLFTLCAVLCMTLNFNTAKASTSLASSDVALAMQEGAYLRLEEERSGIRFRADVTNYDETEELEYGFIIVPVDYLGTAGITDTTTEADYLGKLETAKTGALISTYIDVKVAPTEINGTNAVVQHSIVDIKQTNYDREFFGIAYVTDGTTVKYATILADSGRSVTSMATSALNGYATNEDAEEKQMIYDYQAVLRDYASPIAQYFNEADLTPIGNGEVTGEITFMHTQNTHKMALDTTTVYGLDKNSLKLSYQTGYASGTNWLAGLQLKNPDIKDISGYKYFYFYVKTDLEGALLNNIGFTGDIKAPAISLTQNDWRLIVLGDNGSTGYWNSGGTSCNCITTAKSQDISNLQIKVKWAKNSKSNDFYFSNFRVSNVDPRLVLEAPNA